MNPMRTNNAFASYTETILTSIVLSVVIFMVVMNQPKPQTQQPEKAAPKNNAFTDVESFNFHVHCPLRSRREGGFVELMKHLNVTEEGTIAGIEAELAKIDTFAVFERVFTADPRNSSSEMLMSYCGWARLLSEADCANARFVCTIPGPMFRVAVGTEIAVVWANQIDGPDFDWGFAEDNCYDQANTNAHCWLRAKAAPSESCTFDAPTALGNTPTKLVRIAPTAAPISPHVHGI